MESEQLENYANVVLNSYIPENKEWANYEMKYNIHHRKAAQLQARIIAFPGDIDISVKEKIANMAKQKLIEAYKTISGS